MKWQRDWGLCVGLVVVVGVLLAPSSRGEVALGTAFTYQGQLKKDGAPVQGACDLEFTLHDAATGGAQVGPTETVLGRNVTNGLFTAALDFGQGAFDGNARWLQIRVRLPGGAGWATLSPRQPLTPTPYALLAVEASGLKLPITASVGTAAPALRITNTDTGLALQLANTGDGTTLQVDSESTKAALRVANAGSGYAGRFEGGKGLYATGFTMPTGAVDGYVLASDAAGVGTWRPVVGGGVVPVPLVLSGSIALPGAVISATNNGGGYAVAGIRGGNIGVLGGLEEGVFGHSTDEEGVFGESTNGDAVAGESIAGNGVWGSSVTGWGVFGERVGGPQGGLGHSVAAVVGYGNGGNAGWFSGRVEINGDLAISNDLLVNNNATFGDAEVLRKLTVQDLEVGSATLTDLTVTNHLAGNRAEFTSYVNVGDHFSALRAQFTQDVGVGGDLNVTGFVTKAGGTFKIDHPLDPANKYLYHSFVESPDMMNVYNGNVALDARGEAWVKLPDWFGALNRDYRYQLTPIGGPGPNLYVAEEVKDNRFKIAGGKAGMRVSWQVTGIRQDPYANAHRIIVEQDKAPEERGYYLHPKAHGQPEEKGIQHVRNPRTGALAQRAGGGDE